METPPLRPGKTVLGRGLGNLLGAENKPVAANLDAAAGAGTAASSGANSGVNSGVSAAAGTTAGAATNSTASTPEKTSPPRVTPGVGALLRGGHTRATETLPGFSRAANGTASAKNTASAPDPKAPAEASARSWKLPLLLADLLVLGLVAVLLLRADGRPGILEIGLGVVAVGVGAWLACLAVLPARRRK